jgi:hypothetical protein
METQAATVMNFQQIGAFNLPPVFVMGCPRSGNTLLGNLIGSIPQIHNLGEYGAFHISAGLIPQWGARLLTPYWEKYKSEVLLHALIFAKARSQEAKAETFCDATPWNMPVITELTELFPESPFVFTVRNPLGVIESLKRYSDSGVQWTGKNLDEQIAMYIEFNRFAIKFPKERTIVLSYDELCLFPKLWLKKLTDGLALFGYEAKNLDLAVLAESWSTFGIHSRPVSAFSDETGKIELLPRPRFSERGLFNPKEVAQINDETLLIRQILYGNWPWLQSYLTVS